MVKNIGKTVCWEVISNRIEWVLAISS